MGCIDKLTGMKERTNRLSHRALLSLQNDDPMTYWVRQFSVSLLTSLLCCLLAAGNLPALVHLASHKGAGDSKNRSGIVSFASCACCSQTSEDSSEGDRGHDPNECSICQSLYSLAVPPQVEPDISVGPHLPEKVRLIERNWHPSGDLLIPSSRGPPAA